MLWWGWCVRGGDPALFGEPHNPDVELARGVFALVGMEGQVDPVGGGWWVGRGWGRAGVFDWQVVGGSWLEEAAGALVGGCDGVCDSEGWAVSPRSGAGQSWF